MSGRSTPKIESEFPTAVALSPPWIELPSDVTANILQRLGVVDILESAEKVCTTWRKICCDPSMWRVLHIKGTNLCRHRICDLCHRAVDRSQGQSLHLSIQDFGKGNVLNYIVDRSTHLKSLTLKGFRGSGRAIVEAANKLPHLEELRLIGLLPKIEASDIVKIGNSCPVLKSFTLELYAFADDPEPVYLLPCSKKYEYAVAIAKSMPNLSHLCLMTNLITNEGLEAILDGCLNLESLDLHRCHKLELRGALRKRCSEQIKHIKFPFDLNCFIMHLNDLLGPIVLPDFSDLEDAAFELNFD